MALWEKMNNPTCIIVLDTLAQLIWTFLALAFAFAFFFFSVFVSNSHTCVPYFFFDICADRFFHYRWNCIRGIVKNPTVHDHIKNELTKHRRRHCGVVWCGLPCTPPYIALTAWRLSLLVFCSITLFYRAIFSNSATPKHEIPRSKNT